MSGTALNDLGADPDVRCPCVTAPCREAAMVLVYDQHGEAIGSCDPCIAPIVQALNSAHHHVRTIASCCGHGRVDGSILLADGRQLTITEVEKP